MNIFPVNSIRFNYYNTKKINQNQNNNQPSINNVDKYSSKPNYYINFLGTTNKRPITQEDVEHTVEIVTQNAQKALRISGKRQETAKNLVQMCKEELLAYEQDIRTRRRNCIKETEEGNKIITKIEAVNTKERGPRTIITEKDPNGNVVRKSIYDYSTEGLKKVTLIEANKEGSINCLLCDYENDSIQLEEGREERETKGLKIVTAKNVYVIKNNNSSVYISDFKEEKGNIGSINTCHKYASKIYEYDTEGKLDRFMMQWDKYTADGKEPTLIEFARNKYEFEDNKLVNYERKTKTTIRNTSGGTRITKNANAHIDFNSEIKGIYYTNYHSDNTEAESFSYEKSFEF